jgi:hypothetical protein
VRPRSGTRQPITNSLSTSPLRGLGPSGHTVHSGRRFAQPLAGTARLRLGTLRGIVTMHDHRRPISTGRPPERCVELRREYVSPQVYAPSN